MRGASFLLAFFSRRAALILTKFPASELSRPKNPRLTVPRRLRINTDVRRRQLRIQCQVLSEPCLGDEESRRCFKQQEITMIRIPEVSNVTWNSICLSRLTLARLLFSTPGLDEMFVCVVVLYHIFFGQKRSLEDGTTESLLHGGTHHVNRKGLGSYWALSSTASRRQYKI